VRGFLITLAALAVTVGGAQAQNLNWALSGVTLTDNSGNTETAAGTFTTDATGVLLSFNISVTGTYSKQFDSSAGDVTTSATTSAFWVSDAAQNTNLLVYFGSTDGNNTPVALDGTTNPDSVSSAEFYDLTAQAVFYNGSLFYQPSGSYYPYSGSAAVDTPAATSAPEPASMALLGAGLIGLGVIRRRG
jgi:hypothetical protein